MTRLEKKKNSLKALEARMAGLEAEKKRLEREVASIDRQRETKREILRTYRAGQIFKEAGILDFYNHDDVLQVLLQYREKYLATHPAQQGQADERGLWPWKVNSYKDFMDRFPCFTLGKIKRLLAQLRLAGFIVAKAYKNYDPRDRSLWYRITQKTAEHYTSLAEATAMQQKSKADSDTMLIYACALMDLDVTVLKAAMIKILQTSTFFPSVAEIRFTAEAMVNFYNKTTLPTPSRSAELISKAIAGGPKEAQLVARSRPEEPDEWMWLSEAEKDDLRYDMSRIDRW